MTATPLEINRIYNEDCIDTLNRLLGQVDKGLASVSAHGRNNYHL